MANPSRYREIDWLGGRILEAREMMTLQAIMHGVDSSGNPVTYDLDQLYREGATMNIGVSISGLTATFSPINGSYPMVAMVRGRWEVLTSDDLSTLTLSSSQTHIYLNYALRIVTSTEDASLVDSTTSQATANMGELDLDISATDTSGTGLDGSTQLEKNTTPIVMFQFTNSGTALTRVALDNVKPVALANTSTSGLVKTTTNTPTVVSTDDSRMSDGRSPSAGSVVDASVRTPVVATGTNGDGSSKYDLTVDAGGISAAKIIWQEATERLTDFLAWAKAQLVSIAATIAAHVGQPLGLVGTHPFPTASQVGAAPASHVNLQLGVPGSHPASITTNVGGFVVNDSGGGGSSGAAFGLNISSAFYAGLMHNGDFQSALLNSLVVVPGGSGVTFSGGLSSLFQVAQVLRDHVNQNSHGNPHGLSLADLGGVASSSFQASLVQNGWAQFPGGLLLQWGFISSVINNVDNAVTFPKQFPHTCFGVFPVTTGSNDRISYVSVLPTINGFSMSNNGRDAGCFWFAVGF